MNDYFSVYYFCYTLLQFKLARIKLLFNEVVEQNRRSSTEQKIIQVRANSSNNRKKIVLRCARPERDLKEQVTSSFARVEVTLKESKHV